MVSATPETPTYGPPLSRTDALPICEPLDAAAGSTVLGGDCDNYACVASGWLDVVVEAGLKLHDFAALVPVVEGAGGRMCDCQGDQLTDDRPGEVIAAGDPARVDEIRSEEHSSELQSLMRLLYAVLCLQQNNRHIVTAYYRSYTNR